MLEINRQLAIPDAEIEISAVRAQGAGGQNVNKVSSAAHLRFDVNASSLPDHVRERILALKDRRVTADGVVVIKAQRFRTLERNTEDARQRLADLVRQATTPRKRRIATRPTRAARERRLEEKSKRASTKHLRGRVDRD